MVREDRGETRKMQWTKKPSKEPQRRPTWELSDDAGKLGDIRRDHQTTVWRCRAFDATGRVVATWATSKTKAKAAEQIASVASEFAIVSAMPDSAVGRLMAENCAEPMGERRNERCGRCRSCLAFCEYRRRVKA